MRSILQPGARLTSTVARTATTLGESQLRNGTGAQADEPTTMYLVEVDTDTEVTATAPNGAEWWTAYMSASVGVLVYAPAGSSWAAAEGSVTVTAQ